VSEALNVGAKVGFVGWRGMVGSVLMQRMQQENDFEFITPTFFSTSAAGGAAPTINGKSTGALADANDVQLLSSMDAVISCQGGDYTNEIYPKLRNAGWRGFWIDAASSLRMNADATIVLDPLNQKLIDRGIASGTKNFIGGNCTVSLMMMGINGLINAGLVEWISAMTYQAASGGGAQNMRELVAQMGVSHSAVAKLLADPKSSILEIDHVLTQAMRAVTFPVEHFGVPLAGSLIPWIDKDMGDGNAKEEWKGHAELNKILGFSQSGSDTIPVESTCVRIGSMRCHSQALTIKLKKDVPLPEIESMIASGNRWVNYIPNTKEASVKGLTPTAVSGTLDIAIGRVRKLKFPDGHYINAFTVGDQLLWGAAEPLRRTLRILLNKL
jgi:aspartate-semialdehyde dehydrogenase